MRTFHRVDARRVTLVSPPQAKERLPVGESIAVIAGLSLLSWSAVILFAMALSTAF
jgi:hypothetical protein